MTVATGMEAPKTARLPYRWTHHPAGLARYLRSHMRSADFKRLVAELTALAEVAP